MRALFSLFFCFILSTMVLAACPLVTDTFQTVMPGKSELDFGFGTTQSQTVLANAVGLVFRHGIWPQFDLGLAVPYILSNPAGLNDLYLHAKYQLWRYSENEGITARFDYKFNNGSVYQGLGSGDNDFLLMLIYAKKFGSVQTNFNFGFINTGINAGLKEDDYFAYACAFEQPLGQNQTVLFTEYVGNNSMIPSPTFILLGIRHNFFAGSKIDLGYAFGLNNRSIKNSLTAEMHYTSSISKRTTLGTIEIGGIQSGDMAQSFKFGRAGRNWGYACAG